MKSKLILSLFFNGLLFSSCTYPKENILITSNNVSRCYFESEVVDFCSRNKIEIYNQHIKDLPNFSNDKILLILNHNRSTGKGESRIVKLIVILDGEFKHEVRQFEKSYDNQQAEQISLMV